ncbi:MAG TPA: hypothetical protein VK826_06970, partial [Bacteroidia bacterium]|nr:hypothetical protein [Bacteroidia bacterium]
AFSRVGKDSMALADMLKSEALGNDNVFVSYYLGNCYEAVQDYRNAAINFKQFLFLRGGDTTGPFAFGLIDRSIANGLADEVYGLRLAIYEREVQRSDYFSDAKKTFQKNYNDPQVSIVFPILLNPETIQLQSPSVKFSERDSISLTIDRYTLEITSTE